MFFLNPVSVVTNADPITYSLLFKIYSMT